VPATGAGPVPHKKNVISVTYTFIRETTKAIGGPFRVPAGLLCRGNLSNHGHPLAEL